MALAREARLGKPVVTSNRAMMHAALKRIGVPPGECALRGRRLAGYGIPEAPDDPPVAVKAQTVKTRTSRVCRDGSTS